MLVYQRVYPHFINISQDQQPVVKKKKPVIHGHPMGDDHDSDVG